MRTRASIAGLLLALLAAFAFTGPAAAQEGEPEGEATAEGGAESEEDVIHHAEDIAVENGATVEDSHCIERLVEGGSVDDCQEAPSPILPPANELIWGSVSFVILFGLMYKFALPGIKQGMEARTARIRDDLEGAESAKVEAQQVLDEYRAQLADAKAEAGRIIEEARQQADVVKRDQEARLQTELAAIRERASADIESAKTQAIADLRQEVSNLAIGAAEVVIGRNLDRETQTQLVEQYITSVSNRN